MPKADKKRKKQEAIQQRQSAADDENDDDEEEDDVDRDEGGGGDDDDSDDGEEPLNLGTAEATETMKLDFGFYDPKESDFHGMRALLVGSGSLLPEGASWDVGGLAGVLCEQAEVGSVVKVVGTGEGNEEPDDDEVLGFMSAINLHAHRKARFAQEIRTSFLKRCASARKRDELTAILDEPHAGLLISERMLNLPAALVPSLLDSLLQDIAWAADNADAAERDSFSFKRLVLVAPVSLAKGEASGEASSAASGEAASSSGGGGGGGKKKMKRPKQSAAADHVALLESVIFGRVEEEVC